MKPSTILMTLLVVLGVIVVCSPTRRTHDMQHRGRPINLPINDEALRARLLTASNAYRTEVADLDTANYYFGYYETKKEYWITCLRKSTADSSLKGYLQCWDCGEFILTFDKKKLRPSGIRWF